jgi:hypothetical protein
MLEATNLTNVFGDLKSKFANPSVNQSNVAVTTTETQTNTGTANSNGGNYIDGGEGNDSIFSYGDNNAIVGGSGDDTIFSAGNGNVITGNEGKDKISSVGDKNVIHGGEDDDEISSRGNENAIHGGSGNDKIASEGNKNAIQGGSGDDSLASKGNENTVVGGSGNDAIASAGDKNVISGDDGDDKIACKGNENIVTGGSGNDEIAVKGNKNNVAGNDGDDSIVFVGDENTVCGNAGNDKIYAEGNSNTVCGNEGDDEIYFMGSNCKILGNEGNDKIINVTESCIDTDSFCGGDPHFYQTVNNQTLQSFDLQGRENAVYKMMDNDDYSLNASFKNFTGTDNQSARIITDQNLTLKGSGINIVSHFQGKFEVYLDGQKIGDETNYSDPRIAQKGVSINYANSNLTVGYKGRTIGQNFNGCINNSVDAKDGDSGLLTQLTGALDKDGSIDGVTHYNFDTNNDGKVDANDNQTYNPFNQKMVNSDCSAISAPVLYYDTDNAKTMAENFVTQMNNGWRASYIDEAFNGAFAGAKDITSPNDAKLQPAQGDSQSVIDAKNAMKAVLTYKNSLSETDKQAAVAAVEKWVKSGSQALADDIKNGTGAYASRYKDNSGYSRSQWNEFFGNTYKTTDSTLDAGTAATGKALVDIANETVTTTNKKEFEKTVKNIFETVMPDTDFFKAA